MGDSEALEEAAKAAHRPLDETTLRQLRAIFAASDARGPPAERQWSWGCSILQEDDLCKNQPKRSSSLAEIETRRPRGARRGGGRARGGNARPPRDAGDRRPPAAARKPRCAVAAAAPSRRGMTARRDRPRAGFLARREPGCETLRLPAFALAAADELDAAPGIEPELLQLFALFDEKGCGRVSVGALRHLLCDFTSPERLGAEAASKSPSRRDEARLS